MMENEVVRTFATQIERNSVAIQSLKRSNHFLKLGLFGVGGVAVLAFTELYLFEKRSNTRYYRERHKKD